MKAMKRITWRLSSNLRSRYEEVKAVHDDAHLWLHFLLLNSNSQIRAECSLGTFSFFSKTCGFADISKMDCYVTI